MRIGVISDTHGLLRPRAVAALAGADYILHAGDIGGQAVIEALEEIARVTAIRGNIDRERRLAAYPCERVVRLAGRSFYMLHNLQDMALDPAVAGFDVVISGHSHKPKIETRDGVLYLNPGSAGPRRFTLPVALATLELTEDGMQPRIHNVGP